MKIGLKKISAKLLIPIIFASILLNSVLLYTIWHFQEKNKEALINDKTASFETAIDNNIERISKKGIYIASMVASMDTVVSIYEKYNNGADFDETSKCFINPVGKISKLVETNIGEKPRIHFHLPPARSFYRSWTDKRGDNLSSFRLGVIHVIETGQPINGIEIGRGGFVVLGIVPIKSGGKVLGSVESYFSMEQVMKYSKLSDNEEIAIFMDPKLTDIATEFAQPQILKKVQLPLEMLFC